MTTAKDVVDHIVTGLTTVTDIKAIYTAPPRAVLHPDLPSILIDVDNGSWIEKGLGNNYVVRPVKLYLYVQPIASGKNFATGYEEALRLLDVIGQKLQEDYFLEFSDIDAVLQVGGGEAQKILFTDSGVVKLRHHDNKDYWGVVFTLTYKYKVV